MLCYRCGVIEGPSSAIPVATVYWYGVCVYGIGIDRDCYHYVIIGVHEYVVKCPITYTWVRTTGSAIKPYSVAATTNGLGWPDVFSK